MLYVILKSIQNYEYKSVYQSNLELYILHLRLWVKFLIIEKKYLD